MDHDVFFFGEIAILSTKDLNITYVDIPRYIVGGQFAILTRDSNGQHDAMYVYRHFLF